MKTAMNSTIDLSDKVTVTKNGCNVSVGQVSAIIDLDSRDLLVNGSVEATEKTRAGEYKLVLSIISKDKIITSALGYSLTDSSFVFGKSYRSGYYPFQVYIRDLLKHNIVIYDIDFIQITMIPIHGRSNPIF